MIVVADRPDIVVVVVGEAKRADEPLPEGMIDLDRRLARERAGDARDRRFVGRGLGVSFTVVSALASQMSEPSTVTPLRCGKLRIPVARA